MTETPLSHDDLNDDDDFPTNAERNWAVFCHLGGFAGYLIPFGNVVAPLVLWMMRREQSAYIDYHGREALNFQISVSIYMLVSALLMVVVIGFALLVVVAIFAFVWMIIAAVNASQGDEYRYPLTLRLVS